MTPLWRASLMKAWLLLFVAVVNLSEAGGFHQKAPKPRVQRGSPPESNLLVSWDTVADRARPRILGYQLQYALAERASNHGDTSWISAEGNQGNTWDIAIQVDGFDRLTNSNHTVQDGWYTISFEREYPKPSPLPDLLVETEPIAWDATWSDMETKARAALRSSQHRQYSDWTVSVVRCDETEQRGHEHWAGGCPFLEYGGYSWHLRMSPPEGTSVEAKDYPLVRVTKETVTAKWTGHGDQVVATWFGQGSETWRFLGVEEEPGMPIVLENGSSTNNHLIDPFFCQNGRCMRSLEGLREQTTYAVRLRAYNQHGFGPWEASTTDVSLLPVDEFSTTTTAKTPAPPTPKAPRLSSSTPTSLTVFTDVGYSIEALSGHQPQEYEFEIKPDGENTTRDRDRWLPVAKYPPYNDKEVMNTGHWSMADPFVTATGLQPSTRYRFRVRTRNTHGHTAVSTASQAFATGPDAPSRSPSAPTVETPSVTSDGMTATWSSWIEGTEDDGYKYEAQWQRLGDITWREAKVLPEREDGQWSAIAEGSTALTLHRFRVRAVSEAGVGEWSTESTWIRTAADVSHPQQEDANTTSEIPISVLNSVGGDGNQPGNKEDFDFYHGVGRGGHIDDHHGSGGGSGGAAVIIAREPRAPVPSRTTFFFTGTLQQYAVPSHSDMKSVTLKLWGAGGGGVLTQTAASATRGGDNSTANTTQVIGGGGGFIQAEVRVSPGELLQVLVGGGGDVSLGEEGGAGGFNGGQSGGSGRGGGGGGGGATSVMRQNEQLLASAGGGGGAGNTGNSEACCAEGGAGGGEMGGDGGSPGSSVAALGIPATKSAETCRNGWCSIDPSEATDTSTEGMMETWVTTGGGGGRKTRGGYGGNSDVFDWVQRGDGRQGAVTSPRDGEVSLPVVFGGTRSRAATHGRSLSGGLGANGERGGGGGGGGFYGGGGGGSGQLGGGGGGGSSYANTRELYTAAFEEMGKGVVEAASVIGAGDTWVEIQWDAVVAATAGEEPVWYEVEISKGRGSEDFSLAAKVDAKDGYNPSTPALTSRRAVGATPAKLMAVLSELRPSSAFNVRVSAISRSGPGKPSVVTSFSTTAAPVNIWEQVIPRASRRERAGGRLSSPVLNRPHLGDTDDSSFQEGGAFSDPPTAKRQVLPSARSGHSLVVIAGKVYMFGGLTTSQTCSSPIVGTTALGVSQGSASIKDCTETGTFSDELWEFEPMTKIWTEVIMSGQSPAGRDGHTASAFDSKMIIFGGRGNASSTSGQGTSLLGDAWEIDLDPSFLTSVATRDPTVIPEGTPTFIPLKVNQSTSDGDMCVSDIAISVDIDHPCTGQLQLTLFGPGPTSRDATRFEHTRMARAEPALLFGGCEGIDGCFNSDINDDMDYTSGGSCGKCRDGMDVSFNDSGENMVWGYCEKSSPFEGAYRPVDRLLMGRFLRAPAEGEWALRILDRVADNSNGTVKTWSLDLEMRPCHWQTALRWINTTSADQRASPVPRAHHTAASVDRALFVSGGTGSSGALLDLWRRNNVSSTPAPGGEWLLLSEGYHVLLASGGPFKPHGVTVLVSPWGILSIGGLSQERGMGEEMDAWVVDPVSKLWRPVSVEDFGMRPVTRYHSAAVMLPPTEASGGAQDRSVLLFGGKDDWRRLNDLWRLRLKSVLVSTSVPSAKGNKTFSVHGVWHSTSRPDSSGSWSLAEARRDERCAHNLVSGTANSAWQGACGAFAGGEGKGACTMGTVLDMAWCLGDYQGIGPG